MELLYYVVRPGVDSIDCTASAPAGPWLDSDIQFVVNSLITIQTA